MLSTADLGRRVVVRHQTPLGPTDVLGELTAFDQDRLVVRTEQGEDREIAQSAVLAGKAVGPRPARYSEIIALERVADRAWPAPVVEHRDGWLLRYADGWTNRANSALPLGTDATPVAQTVQACVAFYRERGVLPKIAVPLPVRRDVARYLEAAGWVGQPTVLVRTANLDQVSAPAQKIELLPRPSSELLALIARRKGASQRGTSEERTGPCPNDSAARTQGLPPAAEHVLNAVPQVRFALARAADGALVAGARGVVVDDWLHLGLVEVVPQARRQGLAGALWAALAGWASGLGATRAVLQVEERNEAAARLYASVGFRTHHTYVTYHLPG
jgi:GNAT superfamily N-acetyltransferase